MTLLSVERIQLSNNTLTKTVIEYTDNCQWNEYDLHFLPDVF